MLFGVVPSFFLVISMMVSTATNSALPCVWTTSIDLIYIMKFWRTKQLQDIEDLTDTTLARER
jgi:hypothetical protein